MSPYVPPPLPPAGRSEGWTVGVPRRWDGVGEALKEAYADVPERANRALCDLLDQLD